MLTGALACATLAAPSLAAHLPDRVVAAYYPPLMMQDPDRPGLSIEILQRAAALSGRSLDITFVPFARAVKTIMRREDHLLPAYFRSPARERSCAWVARTHTVHNVFNTLGPAIDTLDEARKLDRIGVETDTAMDVMLSRLGFDNLVRASTPLISTQQLRMGRIDAWALTRSAARWIWEDLGHPERLVQGIPVAIADVYVAASRTVSPALMEDYAGAIAVLQTAGAVDEIVARDHG
ncbi:substrate-binding periplasmic protein [Citreimonas sp.]|uniref:substrate-binding periplasmic protein n=1 Tax=Citreimonas sp. TaxID=3036715 RepID=UPI0040595C69